MRNIMTVIVRLFVDENDPNQLCGSVQPAITSAASQRPADRIPFQDERRLVEIIRSLSVTASQSSSANLEKNK